MFTKAPPKETRERVLAYGGSTVGKSHSILQLAQTVAMLDPTAQVYVIDSDDGLRKIWQNHFASLKNLNWSLAKHWDEVQSAMDALGPVVKPNDWVCVDMIGKFWEMAQSFEVRQVYGKDASEYMLVARAEAVAAAKMNKPATLPGHDWNVIKKLHNENFIDRIVTEFPCNVYATSAADPLIQEFDDQKIITMCGTVGYKPDGEKKNIHRFDTVMFLSMYRDGSRVFTTVKDRARPLMRDIPFTNLFVDYHEALKEQGVPGIFLDE